MNEKPLLIALLIFISTATWAQRTLGPHRPGTKWMQIDTDTVQVVFSDGLQPQASRVASLVHALASDASRSEVGSISDKVTIILRNETGIPNGFVAPSPFRSEFFTTSPQYNFGGTTNWLDLLSIHEYRHVLQNQNAKVDVTKLASVLFGQNGWWFMSGMALPRWYIEGDAVVSETALSRAGRGRVPGFDMEYRALRLAGKEYSYEKASAGSYKDFVPNHYVLGYHLTGYARKQFGKDIWSDVLHDAASFKKIFFPFSQNLKERTGVTTPKLYRKSMAYLDSVYQEITENAAQPQGECLSPEPKVYTNYRQPLFIDNERLLVLKSGLEDVPTFYELSPQDKEKRMFQPGYNTGLNFQASVGDGRVVWAEINYHPRWTREDYSNIRMADLEGESGFRSLSSQAKYFSPALSEDGLQLAAIHRAPENLASTIRLLSISSGEEIRSLPNPDGYRYHHLRWFPSGERLLTVLRKGQVNALASIEVPSGQVRLLTEFTTEHISQPYPGQDWVFFSSTYTGTNNIYAVKPSGGQIYQVTNVKLGAFDPSVSPNGEKLAYTAFSHLGHRVYVKKIRPAEWKPFQYEAEDNPLPLYTKAADSEDSTFISMLEEREFEVKPYRTLSKLFNLHSWNPVSSNPNQRELGLDLEADDKMGTFSTTLGYRYNLNEERGRFIGEVAYGGLFPILKAGFIGNNGRVASRLKVDAVDSVLVSVTQDWTETSVYAGVTLPLNLTFGNMFTSLDLSADLLWQNLDYKSSDERFEQGVDENIQSLDLTLNFSTLKQQAKRHVFPRVGFGAYLRYRSTLGNHQNQGNNFLAQIYGFVPSPFKTHGLRLLLSHNSQDHQQTYRFANFFGSSRGYRVPLHDRATKLAVTYSLPIAYPDWAVGPFAFIQRIKARPFFDHSRYRINRVVDTASGLASPILDSEMNTLGMELLFDLRVLRLLDAEMGVRYNYLINSDALFHDGSSHAVEFVFLSLRP